MEFPSAMPHADLLRYGLLCATALTARANQRQYGMPTTWLPHLTLNTAALLLPDALRLLGARRDTLPAPVHALTAVVCDQQYVWHVAPFTAGYLTSHPRFDIYKGSLGELRLAGFGLDAIPHALTALSFTLLVADALPAVAAAMPDDAALARLMRPAVTQPVVVAGMLLVAVTAAWEFGEWLALRYELEHCADPALINMQWSVPDMLRDCVANAIGWSLAWALRR
jgi:hypothetical protein